MSLCQHGPGEATAYCTSTEHVLSIVREAARIPERAIPLRELVALATASALVFALA
eukprot:CAMPEP_0204235080 /NCGR_PEP_ID=MMETSP0361-20130328/91424_1 /ASSEMBLY_ACC=CAM_ASM_000343 /TAXON_ID=268821 /ORGANISM="Scrippsiella Hangoei, Strain SHTV-5" /LENGTH=55 /DNA_ID=CAMNT_0051206329 /DNA_START=125 /DNA_END=289 /DNA_ORIENTATION=+